MKKIIALLFILFYGPISSQNADPTLRRIALMTGNNVGLSCYNDGAISGFQLNVDIRGEWPIGSGQNYIGDCTPMLGIKLNDNFHSVIISRGPRNRQGEERHPTQGYFWGWNPISGYSNQLSNNFAISNDPSTWPDQWLDHSEWDSNTWYGINGSNNFTGDLESFFVMNDYFDDEFQSEGLGFEVRVRYIQSNQEAYKDIVYKIYEITNTSEIDYEETFWGTVTGTLMGGDGDSSDDISELDTLNQAIITYDYDGIGNVGQQTGIMSEALINIDSYFIHNFEYFNIFASPDMSNDSLLWSRMKEPVPSQYNYGGQPMDGDYLYSINLSSFVSGETKKIVTAFIFGYDKEEVIQKINTARDLYNREFDLISSFDDQDRINLFSLNQNYPNPFNPSTTINYSIQKQSFVTLKVFDILGREIATLVKGEQHSGNYEVEFDASLLTSGIYFYRLKVGDHSTSLPAGRQGLGQGFMDTKKMILLR